MGLRRMVGRKPEMAEEGPGMGMPGYVTALDGAQWRVGIGWARAETLAMSSWRDGPAPGRDAGNLHGLRHIHQR